MDIVDYIISVTNHLSNARDHPRGKTPTSKLRGDPTRHYCPGHVRGCWGTWSEGSKRSNPAHGCDDDDECHIHIVYIVYMIHLKHVILVMKRLAMVITVIDHDNKEDSKYDDDKRDYDHTTDEGDNVDDSMFFM